MKNSNDFRKKYSLEQRKSESSKICIKYPDKIPTIVTKSNHKDAKSLPNIDKNKFLVPSDITLAQFMYVIRKRITINSGDSLFFFCDDKSILVSSSNMESIYHEHKTEDGFLYLTYCTEITFG